MQLPPQLPSTSTLARIKRIVYICISKLVNFVDVVLLFSACLIGCLSCQPFLPDANMQKRLHANW